MSEPKFKASTKLLMANQPCYSAWFEEGGRKFLYIKYNTF